MSHLKFIAQLILVSWVSIAHAGAFDDFFKAVALDDVGTVQRLLQRGFDPNARNEEGQPALLLCMREGSPRVAQLLLDQPQTDADAANAAGETALMLAALKGRSEWVERLVQRGARVNREGWTPLHYAASGGPPELAAWLLDAGARLDARSPNGTTPLMMAARYGSTQVVQVLLDRGANTRLRNQRDLDAAAFARLAGRDALATDLDRRDAATAASAASH